MDAGILLKPFYLMFFLQDFLEDLWSRVQDLSTNGWKLESGMVFLLFSLIFFGLIILAVFFIFNLFLFFFFLMSSHQLSLMA